MYIAFEKNKMFEPESRVMFLGEDVVEAIANYHILQSNDPKSVWVLAQIIDENNSQVYNIVVNVLKKLEDSRPKEEKEVAIGN